jgi:deoxyhypusine synthase
MPKKYRPISLRNINTCRLKTRKSKVGLDKAGKPFHEWSFRSFLDSLPDILAARDFRSVIKAIVQARKKDRPVILGMGAHPIKVGLSPIIVNMIENHIITAIAMNGACIVHDYELALMGHTSEDVDIELCKGTFGMSEETGSDLNKAIKRGVKKGLGVGRAVGDQIMKLKTEFKDLSILAAAARLDIPATVHVAIGTDIIHMHPAADGKAIGEGSLRDFKLLSSVVSDLKGGVYINLGSAVIMPEVFLKAIAVTRNLKYNVKNFTTVNMDFIQHYRTSENVLRRPVLSGGNSYALTGHHEIMFPMLAAAVTEELVKS